MTDPATGCGCSERLARIEATLAIILDAVGRFDRAAARGAELARNARGPLGKLLAPLAQLVERESCN